MESSKIRARWRLDAMATRDKDTSAFCRCANSEQNNIGMRQIAMRLTNRHAQAVLIASSALVLGIAGALCERPTV